MLLQPRPVQPRLTAEQLDQLKRDLAAARVPRATYQSSQTKYGITSEWMAKALPYWRDEFDWNKREERMQEVDHYVVDVDDGEGHECKVHFIAHYSQDPAAIPLLLLHGWPGSFLEFIDVIKILRSSSNPSFHLICPSQPGYGFSSDPPLDRPYGMNDVARLMNSLMCGLGFESGYAAQGGDIGSVIARILAVKYDSCKVININYMPLSAPVNPSPALLDLTEVEHINVEKAKTFASTGRGYGVLQGTRPGTIGMAVQSSPVALLAWLGEKFRDWTDQELPIDTVLETVTMWWILESYPKAIYAYAELTSGVGAWHQNPALYVDKPFSYSSFASEIASAPQSWAKETGNLQYYKYHARGGHFAALEVPEIFASDMQDCFRKLWPMRTME